LNPVYHISSGIFAPLGDDFSTVFESVKNGEVSIRRMFNDNEVEFFGSRLQPHQLALLESYSNVSTLEAMCISAIKDALKQTCIRTDADNCIFILSTTKGNIEWLGKKDDRFVALHHSAGVIAQYFNNPNRPIVVSNACISGSMALLVAKRLLDAKKYKHAIVIGADRLTDFVLDGFKSFQAIAAGYCRPFDQNRDGINLGEAAACMVLSNDIGDVVDPIAILAGGALSNDANHLSGPSRTGAELATAITQAIVEAEIAPESIKSISAHGTATVYNDEMEAKAINLARVGHASLHSLKAYMGHTLGAAGIVESAIANEAMKQGLLLASPSFETLGVSQPINVQSKLEHAQYDFLLKTASGFGGCNAALVWKRNQ
jgi:3-oxoacyl-[acyl-carrier-protein] synthase-1